MIAWMLDVAPEKVLATSAAGLMLFVLVVVLLVAWLRARRRAARLGRERAHAEQLRVEATIEAADQRNRLRIIRELHEVAAHSLSVVISQADGARYAAERDPSAASRSAAVIAETTRSTLADLRRIMSLVGEGESAAVAPRLDTAHELFDIMRDQGLAITVEEFGSAFDLKRGAEIAVYRIVQEALANALAFGGRGTEVRVTLTWSGEGLQLRVEDDGIRSRSRARGDEEPGRVTIEDDVAALTATVTGRGIAEMRARAELYGGILSASTQPAVGFTLSVVFPSLRHHNGVHGVDLRRS